MDFSVQSGDAGILDDYEEGEEMRKRRVLKSLSIARSQRWGRYMYCRCILYYLQNNK